MKVLIEVQCYNRKTITEITLNQIKRYKGIGADLQIVNDHSTEYDVEWLEQFTDKVVQYPQKANINILKYRTFKNFLKSDYDYLYMCDNDAYHDPDFMNQLFLVHQQSGGLPVTLYRSSFIKRCGVYKVTKKLPSGEVRKGLFGGISTFLSRKHIEKINELLPETEEQWDKLTEFKAWDSRWQQHVENGCFAVPELSYVEHYGWKGQNHKNFEDDIALEPTIYLQDTHNTIKKEIIASYQNGKI